MSLWWIIPAWIAAGALSAALCAAYRGWQQRQHRAARRRARAELLAEAARQHADHDTCELLWSLPAHNPRADADLDARLQQLRDAINEARKEEQ